MWVDEYVKEEYETVHLPHPPKRRRYGVVFSLGAKTYKLFASSESSAGHVKLAMRKAKVL
jgi:hypothetical protein